MKLRYWADIVGKLPDSLVERIAKDIKKFNGRRVDITIQQHKNKRAITENKQYKSYCAAIAHKLGFTQRQMNDMIRNKFLRKPVMVNGTEEFVIRDILSKTEFDIFMGNLIEWAKSLEVELPDLSPSVFDFRPPSLTEPDEWGSY